MKLIDLSGQRFGMLTVVSRVGSVRNGASMTPTWRVACDCGREKVVRASNLRAGQTKSCGCVFIRHGMYGTPEYRAWVSMLGRCTNPSIRSYPNYGGRGIRVCPEWEDFETFFAAMGRRPTSGHSLDRIDVNGNYEPANCRWATVKEQARNKRTSHVLSVGGESATISEWAERTGIGKGTIRERLRRGWSPERAIAAR